MANGEMQQGNCEDLFKTQFTTGPLYKILNSEKLDASPVLTKEKLEKVFKKYAFNTL